MEGRGNEMNDGQRIFDEMMEIDEKEGEKNKMNNESMSRLKRLAGEASILAEKDTLDMNQILKTFETSFGVLFPIDAIEKILEIYKKRLSNIVKVEMPAIMIENELTSATLDNGIRLSIKKILSPEVIDKEKEIAWIEKIDHSESIKTVLRFGKGDVDKKLEKYLTKYGYSFEREDSIHYQTLSKIIRDRYNEGEGLPPADAIQVTPFDIVEIK